MSALTQTGSERFALNAAAISVLLVIAGAAAAFVALAADYYGVGVNRCELGCGLLQSFGASQMALLALGVAATLGGSALQMRLGMHTLREALGFWLITGQVALVALIIRLYEIESRAFFELVTTLILCGFVINHHTPRPARPKVFFALGILTIVAVFAAGKPLETALLIGFALAIFWIANLNIAMRWRVLILALVLVALAAVHTGLIETSWSNIVVPLLASMFIFRLVIYLYDTHNGHGPKDLWTRLGYFFLPPNPLFPFFPVVDFATFGRTYYNQAALLIYQRGADWILRGVIHLLLYRVVYQFFTIAPEQVGTPLEFVHFVFANFALYLRISGLFHLIVGVLLLFGFNLHETHSRFYLSSGFIDFWRRINVYWKDFMQKLVFNPAYMALKKRGFGHIAAVLLAIAATFFVTWALHAYQWFWLRGVLHFSLPDFLFWALLGVFLALQTYIESKRPPAAAAAQPSLLRQGLLLGRQLCTLFVICLLWSLWGSATVADWFDLLANAGVAPLLRSNTPEAWALTVVSIGIAALALAVTLGLVPGPVQPARTPARAQQPYAHWRSAVPVGLALLLIAPQALKPRLSIDQQLAIEAVSGSRLNAYDQAAMTRGYYEELTNINRFNSPLWESLMFRPQSFQDMADWAGVRRRNDYIRYDFIPGAEFNAHGVTIRVNSFGMRDREYSLAKPPNTTRIALIGSSRAAGLGVEQEHLFETRLENALDAQAETDGRSVEILNFALPGSFTVERQLLFEERALQFSPDVVLYVSGPREDASLHIARMYRVGRTAPYPVIEDVIERAGLDRSMSLERMVALLAPYKYEVLAEVYRRIAASARANGATPVWLFLPNVQGMAAANSDDVEMQSRLAGEAGFVILNFPDVFAEHPIETTYVGAWDTDHPNAFGHSLIADALRDRLVDLHARGEIDLGLAPGAADAQR